MSIHWFPGHMNKARRELAERVRKCDLVIELLDARLPWASANPMLERMTSGLPCVALLTKTDLADPSATERWREHYEARGRSVEDVVTTDKKLGPRLTRVCERLAPERTRRGFPVRAMIVGIPNVGKSTLFNTLLGAHKANVQDRPAVTRQEQQGRVSNGFLIVDTPGVLWPKLEDQRAARCLAAAGSISEAAFDPTEIADFALRLLAERYPEALTERYAISGAEAQSLDAVGRKRGCLLRGGVVDHVKAASIVLGDLRGGKFGRVSLELPEDYATPAEPEPEPAEELSADP